MPRVSAIIPTFGRPELVGRAVASVLAQTMSDLELIVVIDGDDPDTQRRMESVRDPRLKLIAHDQKRGAGEARNTGALAAQAPWIAFLDDDDEWLPTKIERQLELTKGGPAIIMTQSHVVTPKGSFVRPLVPYSSSQSIDDWLFDRTTWFKGGLNFLQSSSLMVPRNMFDGFRFVPGRAHEDWEMVIRAVKLGGLPLLTVPEPLVIHYLFERRASLSKTFSPAVSIHWVKDMADLLTPRARAAFLLNTVGTSAANTGSYRWMLPLFALAFREGRPTAKQITRFALSWLLPTSLRRKARGFLQGGRPPEHARNIR